MKKVLESIVIILLAVVLPLSGKLELILTWPSLSIAAIGLILLFTQPEVPNKTDVSVNSKRDKNTALLILGGSLVAYQITLIDAAYISNYVPRFSDITTYIGLSLMVFGMVYRAYVIKYLGKFFTAQVTIMEDHQLIKAGPYKALRHPSYTAAFITFIGIAILFNSYIGAGYVLFIYFPIQTYRIRLEEKALTEKFGEDYSIYKNESKRMFPFIW